MRYVTALLLALAACGAPTHAPGPLPPGTVLEGCGDVCQRALSVWPTTECRSGSAVDEPCAGACPDIACGPLPCLRVRLVCE